MPKKWIPPSQEVAAEELLGMAIAWGMMTILLASVNPPEVMEGMFNHAMRMSEEMVRNGDREQMHARVASGMWYEDIKNPEHVKYMKEQFGWVTEMRDDDEED